MLQREGVLGETYNIGTGVEMTNLEMVEILLDAVLIEDNPEAQELFE